MRAHQAKELDFEWPFVAFLLVFLVFVLGYAGFVVLDTNGVPLQSTPAVVTGKGGYWRFPASRVHWLELDLENRGSSDTTVPSDLYESVEIGDIVMVDYKIGRYSSLIHVVGVYRARVEH